ncbi:MAG TPA: NAD(P)-dependent oxidoreductase [Candidatus Limnocylindrales bacterium]|nr:NAD(P)-dependent oxidoreductase [Candidatus Limnocylindrales bacterium]
MTDAMPAKRIGFIGLGHMGMPMVARLVAAGHEVHGFDLSAEARERAAAVGASVADELAGAIAEVELVILMLPDSNAVAAVTGDPAFREAIRTGTTVIDMGSSQPERTRVLAADFATRGVRLVDAPVSGGVAGAERGSLAIMVGGAPEDVDRVTPVLSVMGRVVRAGPSGAGHAVKALNNLLSATHLWVTSEAIVAGERFGLDPATMLDIFNGSSGRSGSTENKWPNFILPGTFASGFGLRLMVKDIRIAVELAAAAGAPAHIGEEVVKAWVRAADDLPPEADHTEVARWIAADAGPADA